MADITACTGTGCPNKEICYRHTCRKCEHNQAYFMQVPLKEDGTCDHFMADNRAKKELKNEHSN